MKQTNDCTWEDAKCLCALTDEEVRMAKELGFQPRYLIKNIPSPSEKWKLPVGDWVRSLHEKKFGATQAGASPAIQPSPNRVIEFRNPEYPWPDRPKIPKLVFDDLADSDDDDEDLDPESSEYTFRESFEPPSESDIDEENAMMLRHQRLFRWAAQSIAIAMSKLTEVQRVAAFGAVARPLEMEVPRFREFRRHRVEILHECTDLDLAVWTTDQSRLKELKIAMGRALSSVQNTPYGGVANHQVDVHVLEAASGAYRGRLCSFGQCPKKGKIQCLVPGCGAQPFLRQFEKYWFNPGQFEAEPKVILFDRATGFLVRSSLADDDPRF